MKAVMLLCATLMAVFVVAAAWAMEQPATSSLADGSVGVTSPLAAAEGAKSLRAATEGAKSPRAAAEGAKSPRAATDGAMSPLAATDGAMSPLADMSAAAAVTYAEAFPDPNFRQFVLFMVRGGNTSSSVISDADKEKIASYTELDIAGRAIGDVTGLEYFTALE